MSKLRLLSYLVMAYMTLALGWWAVLLYQQNSETRYLKEHLNEYDPEAYGTLQDIDHKYNRQVLMIFGEAAVFLVSLIFGLWFIQRGYKNQLETSEEKRNFLLAVTHELKSPIASIQLALETMKNRDLNEDQKLLMINNATKDSKRLDKLVNNLLLAANVESTFVPHKVEMHMIELLKDIIAELKEVYNSHLFTLGGVNDSVIIMADYEGSRSVLSNIIENAAKYSPKGSRVDIVISEETTSWLIDIYDQGDGISEKEHERIFGKFYRIGSEEVRRARGTGLGLYIVKRILDAHGWKLNIEKNEPKGSIFKLYIPRSSE